MINEEQVQPLLRPQKAGMPVSMFTECCKCTKGLKQPSSSVFCGGKVTNDDDIELSMSTSVAKWFGSLWVTTSTTQFGFGLVSVWIVKHNFYIGVSVWEFLYGNLSRGIYLGEFI